MKNINITKNDIYNLLEEVKKVNKLAEDEFKEIQNKINLFKNVDKVKASIQTDSWNIYDNYTFGIILSFTINAKKGCSSDLTNKIYNKLFTKSDDSEIEENVIIFFYKYNNKNIYFLNNYNEKLIGPYKYEDNREKIKTFLYNILKIYYDGAERLIKVKKNKLKFEFRFKSCVSRLKEYGKIIPTMNKYYLITK